MLVLRGRCIHYVNGLKGKDTSSFTDWVISGFNIVWFPLGKRQNYELWGYRFELNSAATAISLMSLMQFLNDNWCFIWSFYHQLRGNSPGNWQNWPQSSSVGSGSYRENNNNNNNTEAETNKFKMQCALRMDHNKQELHIFLLAQIKHVQVQVCPKSRRRSVLKHLNPNRFQMKRSKMSQWVTSILVICLAGRIKI